MYKKVSQDEFYKAIGNQDVVLSVKEPSPYKVEFRLRHDNKLVGYQDRDDAYYVLAE